MDTNTVKKQLFEGSAVDSEALNSFSAGETAIFELPVLAIIVIVVVVFTFGLVVYYTQRTNKKDESGSDSSDSDE